jgi:hypothetical protein
MKVSPRLREADKACGKLRNAVKIMEAVNRYILMFYIHQRAL